mgnify:CR=1 FL=1
MLVNSWWSEQGAVDMQNVESGWKNSFVLPSFTVISLTFFVYNMYM